MKEKKGAPYAVYHVSTAASAAIADANATPRHVASCANTTTSPLFVAAISYKDGRDEDFLYVRRPADQPACNIGKQTLLRNPPSRTTAGIGAG